MQISGKWVKIERPLLPPGRVALRARGLRVVTAFYASDTFSEALAMHPRHADVAPARAPAAPRGALLLWYRRR